MHPTLILVMSAGLVFATESPKPDPAKAELEKFQGTWQLVSAETDGKKTPEDVVKKVRVVIKGAKHTVHVGDEVAAEEVPFNSLDFAVLAGGLAPFAIVEPPLPNAILATHPSALGSSKRKTRPPERIPREGRGELAQG